MTSFLAGKVGKMNATCTMHLLQLRKKRIGNLVYRQVSVEDQERCRIGSLTQMNYQDFQLMHKINTRQTDKTKIPVVHL